MKLRLLLLPSLADSLFAALLVWMLGTGVGRESLLADGDTGWHIRTGEIVLDTGRVPRTDPFSLSKGGAPWFAWEWLSDVAFAAAHRRGGLKGVVLLSGIAIAAALTVAFRHAIWRGADVFSAAAVCLMAAGASSIHFLARPHVFSLLLMAASLWLVDRDRKRPGLTVWALAPLTALWANLHGGFAGLLASLAVLAAGSLLEKNMAGARRYGYLLAGCGAASLVNPFGFALHAHIAAYLRSDWIRSAVDEFQSPRFRSESAFQFEVLLFAAVAVGVSFVRERRYAEALLLAAWGHAALVSARHIPVFAVICAPPLAAAVSRLWQSRAGRNRRSVAAILGRVAAESTGAAKHWSMLPAAAAAVLAALPLAWPRDFPASKFPAAITARHPELGSARVFTSDQWGDYLLYRNWPRQKVLIDGRSDFYGETLGKRYLALVSGRPGWSAMLDADGIEFVLAGREWPLTQLLEQAPGWRRLDDGGPAILFIRH